MMHRLLFLAFALLSLHAMAQEPSPCALVVPNTVTANSDTPAQATCPCRITELDVTVYNRWGVELWRSSSLEGFPGGLLTVQDLPAGTYLWKVKYTAVADGTPTALEATGFVNVLK